MRVFRVSIAQINPTVGNIEGNTEKIIDYINKARQSEAHIVIFPELAITGYPPEDLLLKPRFVAQNLHALDEIRANSKGIIVIVGFIDRQDDIFNSAAIISEKVIVDIYHKQHLPNYGVFDENRYFQSGSVSPVYRVDDIMFGVNICEDIWYAGGPARTQALAGAEVIVNINASPYHFGKTLLRQQLLLARAVDNRAILIYANMVGGQDELVFDGGSFIVNEEGSLIARAPQFSEAMTVSDLNIESVIRARLRDPRHRQEARSYKGDVRTIAIPFKVEKRKTLQSATSVKAITNGIEEVYQALMLGTSDYVRKNGFKHVVIGLSGGVDSALVAAVAVDALGADNVTGTFMPSPFTSRESHEDVDVLGQNLGIEVIKIGISEIFQTYKTVLKEPFTGYSEDSTEENLQARIRGNLLMALSNKFGWLVLTTGNKSEMSVGYATLYGDMAGGFAVIKDVPKKMVYELCQWRNQKEGKPFIPERILTKEPTAELREDQKDTDSLPPYSVLDPILKAYVEDELSLAEIIAAGGDKEIATRVITMVDLNEYKRRQAPPGIKITPRAFGRDRRFPITNRFRNY